MPERGSEPARYEGWAAIEQALQKLDCTRKGRVDTALYELKLKAVAAVGEAKRRESELDHEVNGPSGLREQLEAARKGEQIEFRMRQKAEARAAELERALDDECDMEDQARGWITRAIASLEDGEERDALAFLDNARQDLDTAGVREALARRGAAGE